MVNKLFVFYDRHIETFSIIVEQVFQFSMIVLIFIQTNNLINTYINSLFTSLFIAFGLWSFRIKNKSTKLTIFELFLKMFVLILSAFMIDLLSGKIQLNGLYSIFYSMPLIFLNIVENRKSEWPELGKLSTKEFLERSFGKKDLLFLPSSILYLL